MKVSKTWKACESRIGSWHGAKGLKCSGRVPLSGSNSGKTSSDSPHPTIYIETKRDKTYHSVIKLWYKYKIKLKDKFVVSLPIVKDGKVLDRYSDIWCVYNNDIFEMFDNVDGVIVCPWAGMYPKALTLYEESIATKNSFYLDKNKKVVVCCLVYHNHPGFWVIINKNDIIEYIKLIKEARIERENLIKEEKYGM